MPFQPQVQQQLLIDGVSYRIAEHPAARGQPYAQEGPQATVYQLVAEDGTRRALKVFKPRWRLPVQLSLAGSLEAHAEVPGLSVCRRTVLSPLKHPALLRQHPDLIYSVLMPWIDGPTWTQILLSRGRPPWPVLAPERSQELARRLAGILAGMEARGLAHCDLSAPNLMIPALAPKAPTSGLISLVDVEQLCAPNLTKPDSLPDGLPGYLHRSVPRGLWAANADRFAGALLLAEVLAWCDEQVCQAAWGASYFDSVELQQEGVRYELLSGALAEHWGVRVAGLFERAWRSPDLASCPRLDEWSEAAWKPAVPSVSIGAEAETAVREPTISAPQPEAAVSGPETPPSGLPAVSMPAEELPVPATVSPMAVPDTLATAALFAQEYGGMPQREAEAPPPPLAVAEEMLPAGESIPIVSDQQEVAEPTAAPEPEVLAPEGVPAEPMVVSEPVGEVLAMEAATPELPSAPEPVAEVAQPEPSVSEIAVVEPTPEPVQAWREELPALAPVSQPEVSPEVVAEAEPLPAQPAPEAAGAEVETAGIPEAAAEPQVAPPEAAPQAMEAPAVAEPAVPIAAEVEIEASLAAAQVAWREGEILAGVPEEEVRAPSPALGEVPAEIREPLVAGPGAAGGPPPVPTGAREAPTEIREPRVPSPKPEAALPSVFRAAREAATEIREPQAAAPRPVSGPPVPVTREAPTEIREPEAAWRPPLQVPESPPPTMPPPTGPAPVPRPVAQAAVGESAALMDLSRRVSDVARQGSAFEAEIAGRVQRMEDELALRPVVEAAPQDSRSLAAPLLLWALLVALGWAGILAFNLFATAEQWLLLLIGWAVAGAVVGLLQWLVSIRIMPGAVLWVVFSAAGWAAAWFLAGFAREVLERAWIQWLQQAGLEWSESMRVALGWYLTWLLALLFSAVVSAAGAAWLFARARRRI